MPKYRSSPRTITAVQFGGDVGIASPSLMGAMVRGDSSGYEVWNGLHNTWIKLKPGDYIRIDDSTDNYPIDEDTFNNTYTLIKENDDGQTN